MGKDVGQLHNVLFLVAGSHLPFVAGNRTIVQGIPVLVALIVDRVTLAHTLFNPALWFLHTLHSRRSSVIMQLSEEAEQDDFQQVQ